MYSKLNSLEEKTIDINIRCEIEKCFSSNNINGIMQIKMSPKWHAVFLDPRLTTGITTRK